MSSALSLILRQKADSIVTAGRNQSRHRCKMRAPVMTKSTAGRDSTNIKGGAFPLVDPRQGDAEDDAASPGQRSLLVIAGSLLAEVSLPKLLFAWTVSLLLPAVLLGLSPLVTTAWLATVSEHILVLTCSHSTSPRSSGHGCARRVPPARGSSCADARHRSPFSSGRPHAGWAR